MAQLMHSFRGYHAPEELLALVRTGEIAAFCLFAGLNVQSPEQVRALTTSLSRAAESGGLPPPIIGIDQEGGQLIAIRGGATELPGNMALGATRSPELAERAGRVLGRELLAMGINANFAPSLDVNINPYNPVVGTRAFSDDPALVAELGVALIKGLQAEGILAIAKHFPGHGDTHIDSHHGVPVVAHDKARLDVVEMLPFREAMAAGVDGILSSHIIFTALDPEQPATVSHAILSGWLRGQLGYGGLLVTDAMDMHAVARLGAAESVRAALGAGNDLILLGHLPDQIALTHQFKNHLHEPSLARIGDARRRLPTELPDLVVIGSPEHQAVAQEIANQSITLVRDWAGVLPLRLNEDEPLGLVYIQPTDLTPADTSSAVALQLAPALRQRHSHVAVASLPYRSTQAQLEEAVAAVAECTTVVVGTISATHDPRQAELIRALRARGQQVIAVALREPYDLMAFREVETYLCIYSVRAVSMEALARVLFGERKATGLLPVGIPGLEAEFATMGA